MEKKLELIIESNKGSVSYNISMKKLVKWQIKIQGTNTFKGANENAF